MKKVIEGKLYNTDTAVLLGKYANDYSKTEFGYVRESLYRTKSRAYFIHGEGGSLTKYALSCGNNTWCGGEKIIPMTREAAREWAEEKLSVSEYEKIFGVSEADGGVKEKLNLSLSPGVVQKLEILSEETGKSISQLVEEKFM